MKLVKYLGLKNCNIASIVDENEKVISFTVADRNMEKVTDKTFPTAMGAIEYAETYKDLTSE